MTTEAYSVLKTLMSLFWALFTAWKIPGTNVTPGAFLVFLIVAVTFFRLFSSIADVSVFHFNDRDKK